MDADPQTATQHLALEVLEKTLRSLSAQNRLLAGAAACPDLEALTFHILNHLAEAVPYDRAVLLAPEGGRLLGVSGTAAPAEHSALADDWRAVAAALPPDARIVTAGHLAALPENVRARWNARAAQVGGCAILRQPLGGNLPELWLERWHAGEWREKEVAALEPTLAALGHHWRRLATRDDGWRAAGRRAATFLRRRGWAAALGGALLACIPLRLRIVAPCEIVPQAPAAITARVDGVVEKVLVRLGDPVQPGQPLVRLEGEIALHERQAARQALNEVYARYTGACAAAVRDPAARGQLPELLNRLRQERARLALADYRVRNLEIVSPAAGVAVITDPDEWSGRPIAVGERILTVADPNATRVRIYLPLTDRVDFPEKAGVSVILDNSGAASYAAELRQVAAAAADRPGGGACFWAEADWKGPTGRARDAGLTPDTGRRPALGVSGTAVVYGERVPLFIWLLRRPLAAVREWAGM